MCELKVGLTLDLYDYIRNLRLCSLKRVYVCKGCRSFSTLKHLLKRDWLICVQQIEKIK